MDDVGQLEVYSILRGGPARLRFPDGVPLGSRGGGGELLLNPPPGTRVVVDDDDLLILAEDDSAIELRSAPVPGRATRPWAADGW